MSNDVDYTPILLAQVTALQMRMTNQEAVIASLKSEVERFVGRTISLPSVYASMKASVPLSAPRQGGQRASYEAKAVRRPRVAAGPGPAYRATERSAPRPTMTLSDVLKADERVTLSVRLPKEEDDAEESYATALATFDGTDLAVTECKLVSSLVGMKSAKPGEILYKFIDDLKTGGHIKRTFTIAPWRLCSVVRDGTTKTLEELRGTTQTTATVG